MVSFRNILIAIVSCFTLPGHAGLWYVSLTGSDTGTGTIQNPFLTISRAAGAVQPGDTIFVRGGTYNLFSPVALTKSGTETASISLVAYKGEKVVLDFSGQSMASYNYGIKLTGSYWYIKGINIAGAGDNGMKIESGSYNTIVNCSFYRNRDSGLQLDNGASYNNVINCDSYFNADPTDYGDADGFSPKLTVGTGNYFYGCRAWKNCDDGWDGYLRGADDVSTILENCWSFQNGYLEDGTDPGINANGNGFKMGGSDDKTLRHNFTLKRCLAFKNKAKGFDQNNNKGSMILYNCTGYNNLVADFRITQTLASGKVLIVKNCADLGKTAEIGSFAEQAKNSWMSPFIVTTADFISTDDAAAYGPRKADGSLPDIDFMHLAPGSDLIDAGVNLGYYYSGSAPDLGCFESISTGIRETKSDTRLIIYPNPVKDNGAIRLFLGNGGKCEIRLSAITGSFIKTIAERWVTPGDQSFDFDMSGINPGLYLISINLNNVPVASGRIIKCE